MTGDVVMHQVFAETTQEEARTLIPLVFVIIAAAAAILLRSVFGTLALVIALTFTVNTTMGFAGWIGTVLNPANSGIPIIVLTVAVAHSIHIVASVLEGMERGLGRNEAIAEALRDNIWPVFLTTATTAIGFLSLNASDSPPFRVLGNLVAFGVLCAFLYFGHDPAGPALDPAAARAARIRRTARLLRPVRRFRRGPPQAAARFHDAARRTAGFRHSSYRPDRQLDPLFRSTL